MNYKSQWNIDKIIYKLTMEIIIIITLALFAAYVIFRPTSKEELKRFEDNENWSNMGF